MMERWIKYVMVVCMLLAMVIPASMACGGDVGAATPTEAVQEFIDAYEAKDAAGMIACETADVGGRNSEKRTILYERLCGDITELNIGSVRIWMITETDTDAQYRASYARGITISDEHWLDEVTTTFTLEKSGGWLISSDHADELLLGHSL